MTPVETSGTATNGLHAHTSSILFVGTLGYPNLFVLGLQSGLWLSLGLWDLALPLGQFAAVLDHSDMQVMLLC